MQKLLRGGLAVLAGAGLLAGCAADRPSLGELRGRVLPEPIARPAFTMSDAAGEPYDFGARTAGKLTFLFFGYTHCPDICPVHMASLAAALGELPYEARQQVEVVFVTVDPERDTPERLREWLGAFDPRFVALRGTLEEANAVAALAGFPPSSHGPPENGGYGVGHPASVIAFSPDGPARVVYPFGTRREDWAHDLPILLRLRGDEEGVQAPATVSPPGAPAGVGVTRAYVTRARMAGAAALYAVIENATSAPAALVAVDAPAARVELHETVREGEGVAERMRMQPVAEIPVAAGGTARLEPGGYHVMLLGPALEWRTRATRSWSGSGSGTGRCAACALPWCRTRTSTASSREGAEMQWWCSASGAAWSWQWQAYPGVWLFVLATAALYGLAVRRIHGAAGRARGGWRRAAGWTGVVLVWLALDWPLGALGAGYLSSAHSTQFLLLAFIAPPLLLLGAGPLQPDAAPRPASAWLAPLRSPLTALLLFNVIVAATHMPRVVDRLMVSQPGAFAIDAAWLLGGLLFWRPVLLTRRPFHPLAQIGYIFWGTIAHTGIGVWFLLADFPLYALFELAPPIPGTDPMRDQQLAGGIMELVGMIIIFGAVSLVALRWMTRENAVEAEMRDRIARGAPLPEPDRSA